MLQTPAESAWLWVGRVRRAVLEVEPRLAVAPYQLRDHARADTSKRVAYPLVKGVEGHGDVFASGENQKRADVLLPHFLCALSNEDDRSQRCHVVVLLGNRNGRWK